MKNENDLRVLKTRKAITESFLVLLAKKSFDDISVTEICKAAHCSRNTFYVHFPYKEALYDSIIDSYVDKICECLTETGIDELPKENNEEYFSELMSRVADAFLSQRKKIRPILEGDHSKIFFDRVTEVVRNTLIDHSEHIFPDSSKDSLYRLVCWYSAAAMVGFLQGCTYDVDIPDSEARALFGKIHSLACTMGLNLMLNNMN